MMAKSEGVRFLKKLAILLICLFMCDRIIGYALSSLYFGLKKGQYAQMTNSINGHQPSDIMIFGSSRAIRHYSPAVIKAGTGLSCYNFGRDAQYVPYYAAIEEAALKKSIPKLIIIDMNVWEFTINKDKYEKLSALLPYAIEHPEFRPYIDEVSRWEKYKVFSRTYPFNSTLFIAMHDRLRASRLPNYENGYLPLEYSMSKKDFETYKANKAQFDRNHGSSIPIDPLSLEYFRAFLNRALKYHIKTFVIISPTILPEAETREKKLIRTIASEYANVIFKDYSHDSTYANRYEKFADNFHLNKQGSVEYSKRIANLVNDRLLATTAK